jgi:hypothetical protein
MGSINRVRELPLRNTVTNSRSGRRNPRGRRAGTVPGEVGQWAAAAHRWSAKTPGRLRLQVLLVAVAAGALLASGTAALGMALRTETSVHQQTVAAIVGVQRLHAWLAAADRSAANSYLSGGAELTLPQQQYEADIAAASRELELAAERGPDQPAVSPRLQSISQGLSEYTRQVDTAMVQHRLGNPDGMASLRAASDQMHRPGSGILAEVEAVEGIYADDLQRDDRQLTVVAALLALFAACAVAVVTLLVWTQRFVRRRFRRRRNKRLLAATTAAVLVVAGTAMGVAGARQSIVASQGQYARLLNLWHARSLAYDANGATSLFLISRAQGVGPNGDAVPAQTAQLVDRPLTDQILAAARNGDVQFDGLLADELRAAGSRTEREAAMKVVVAYRQFLDIDASVHQQAAAGRQSNAVALTLGTYGAPLGLAFKSMEWGPRLGAQRDWSEGELGYAFEEFDWDLAQLTQMLQRQFDDTMQSVERLLVESIALQVLTLAVAGLTFAGLRPRIAEYSA